MSETTGLKLTKHSVYGDIIECYWDEGQGLFVIKQTGESGCIEESVFLDLDEMIQVCDWFEQLLYSRGIKK